MGTNYNVEWNPGGGSGGPVSVQFPQPIVVMHFNKSFSTFQGTVFNSWAAWKNFLLRNECSVTIRDEYGTEHDVHTIIKKVEGVAPESRGSQYRWIVENGHSLDRDWLDPDGYSFYAGEFS